MILSASITIKPAIIALVVAMAGIMFPASATNVLSTEQPESHQITFDGESA
jgi:hypothetical protein